MCYFKLDNLESHLFPRLLPRFLASLQSQNPFFVSFFFFSIFFLAMPPTGESSESFTMPSSHPSHDAIPLTTISPSEPLHQRESQQSGDQVKPPAVSPASSRRTCTPLYYTQWKWESVACLLNLAVPIIIFATMYPFDGNTLPQWPFKITINSLLSIYTLVLKTAIGVILTSCIGQLQWTWFSKTRPLTDMLYFDNATRGPAGAVGLIWRQRFRRPLTVLGCLIAVLVAVVDPFVQQLIRPVDCRAVATLPRTNAFEYLGLEGNKSAVALDMDIEDVLNRAVVSPGQIPPWQCKTGTCTFPDTYATIGVCSSCQDAASDVKTYYTCPETDSSDVPQHYKSAKDCGSNFTVHSTFTTSDESIQLSTEMTNELEQGFNGMRDVAAAGSLVKRIQSGGQLVVGFLLGLTPTGRVDWSAAEPPTCNSNETERSWGCQGYGAATCFLRPCVQVYKANISAGVLKEDLVASSSDTAWGTIYNQWGTDSHLALLDTRCSNPSQASSDDSATMEGRWKPFNLSLTGPGAGTINAGVDYYPLPLASEAEALLNSNCLYLVSSTRFMNLVGQYFNGTVQSSLSSDLYGNTQSYGRGPDYQGAQVIQSLYHRGNTDFERVQSIMANVSDALTIYIRTHGVQRIGNDTTERTFLPRDAEGKVLHFGTCLQVQWPWISFPACLAALTTLFFLAVVEATTRTATSFWKASPLAWILSADGPLTGQFSSSSRTCEELEERSKQVAVHVSDKDPAGTRIYMADIKDPDLGGETTSLAPTQGTVSDDPDDPERQTPRH